MINHNIKYLMLSNLTFVFKVCLLVFLLLTQSYTFAQNIKVDGLIEDWEAIDGQYADTSGDGPLDFLQFNVIDDENFLYIMLELASPIKLTGSNQIAINIDTDNNASTGFSINGIGADLRFYPGQGKGILYVNGSIYDVDFNDLLYSSMPTLSSTTHEILFRKDAKPAAGQLLFGTDNISIVLEDIALGGDLAPNNAAFGYQMTHAPINYELVDFDKLNDSHLRLMTYNALFNGIVDPSRQQYFKEVISRANPDIITLNECWSVSDNQARSFIENAIPDVDWYISNFDNGNITISRYPIVNNWNVYPDRRVNASLINLPGNYTKDVLIVNAHLKCCDADTKRQLEADAFAAFVKDAKNAGGSITLPFNTPIILSGDLNMVGGLMPLNTIFNGDIVNINEYGIGGLPDWNDSPLSESIARHTDINLCYTWREAFSEYQPSRLDFMIYTDSAMDIEKSFIVNTEAMSQERLFENNLSELATFIASDHLPVVTDFSIPMNASALEEQIANHLQVYYDAANHQIQVQGLKQSALIEIYTSMGSLTQKAVINPDNNAIWIKPSFNNLVLINIFEQDKRRQVKLLLN